MMWICRWVFKFEKFFATESPVNSKKKIPDTNSSWFHVHSLPKTKHLFGMFLFSKKKTDVVMFFGGEKLMLRLWIHVIKDADANRKCQKAGPADGNPRRFKKLPCRCADGLNRPWEGLKHDGLALVFVWRLVEGWVVCGFMFSDSCWVIPPKNFPPGKDHHNLLKFVVSGESNEGLNFWTILHSSS